LLQRLAYDSQGVAVVDNEPFNVFFVGWASFSAHHLQKINVTGKKALPA